MRIEGLEYSTIRNKSTVILDRSADSGLPPIELTVHALPPTYVEDAEREIPSPNPPRFGVLKDKKGRIEKDAAGRPVMQYDEQDPEYMEKLREVKQLHAIKMVVDALDPEEVTFEAQKGGSLRNYYVAVRKEMADLGISIGDLATLIKAVVEVSNLGEDDLKEARLDFFETEDSQDGSSNIGSAES